MRSVAPPTNASVLPASYQVAPIAAARDAGTATWSLHDTHAKPARSAARAAATISAPPTARSHARVREGICCTPGRLVPKRGIPRAGTARLPRTSRSRYRVRMRLPTYAELLQRTDAPPGTSWGLFGESDELGTLNLL